MNKPDYRTKQDRENEVLAQLEIDNGLSVAWLAENKQRPAALTRLLDAGVLRRLPCKHPSMLRFADAVPARHGFWRRMVARFKGGASV